MGGKGRNGGTGRKGRTGGNGGTGRKGRTLWVLCLVLLWTTPSFGHHALSEYDDTRVTTIEGTLSEIRIKNPHSSLTIQVHGANGADDRWTVEWLAALVLRKEGVENTTLKPGDRLIITGNASRDRTARRLWLRTVTRPSDGWTWSGKF
jgi:uncharacterized protein DUF6152